MRGLFVEGLVRVVFRVSGRGVGKVGGRGFFISLGCCK